MRERGILMSAPMVRALLSGTKSQTRRLAKLIGAEVVEEESDGVPWIWSPQNDGWIACPYGVVGDRLYVKETFAPMCHQADPTCWCETEDAKARNHFVEYRADLAPECTDRPGGWPLSAKDDPDCPKWKPAIFMPRTASRITLELTGVRVERLQSISEADAKAEGTILPVHKRRPLIQVPSPHLAMGKRLEDWTLHDYWVSAYACLWEEVNGKRAPWASNPWVWVLSFQRVQP